MNIQELKKMMDNPPTRRKSYHNHPLNKPMSTMKHHDTSKGMAPKAKALEGAKELKVGGSKFFSEMNDKEKDSHVNAGRGMRLTKAMSAFKTKDWPRHGSPIGDKEMSKDYGSGKSARFN